jgi:hypothetical protein
MSIIDFSPYEAQRRAYGQQYGATSARNAYARFLAQQRGTRNIAELQRNYEMQQPNVVSSFTQRGLAGPGVQSGVFQKGLQEFARKQYQDVFGAQQDLADQVQGFDLEERQAAADYQSQLADLEMKKQREISQAAATLNSFKPFLG